MAVWGAEYPLVTEKADGGVVAAGATGYGSPVYEALGEAAFHERRKIHDLIMEGIDAILKKRQVWGGAVGAVGDLISGVVGKTPWAPAPHARRLRPRYWWRHPAGSRRQMVGRAALRAIDPSSER